MSVNPLTPIFHHQGYPCSQSQPPSAGQTSSSVFRAGTEDAFDVMLVVLLCISHLFTNTDWFPICLNAGSLANKMVIDWSFVWSRIHNSEWCLGVWCCFLGNIYARLVPKFQIYYNGNLAVRPFTLQRFTIQCYSIVVSHIQGVMLSKLSWFTYDWARSKLIIVFSLFQVDPRIPAFQLKNFLNFWNQDIAWKGHKDVLLNCEFISKSVYFWICFSNFLVPYLVRGVDKVTTQEGTMLSRDIVR